MTATAAHPGLSSDELQAAELTPDHVGRVLFVDIAEEGRGLYRLTSLVPGPAPYAASVLLESILGHPIRISARLLPTDLVTLLDDSVLASVPLN